MLSFINSFQSEWLKTRRSLASWIVIAGGFFTPAIIIIARLIHHEKLALIYASDIFWKMLWGNSWESMAIFLLPMGVVLATSLLTQIEYKNNTWKLLFTMPLNLSTIFFSKLLVIIIMMLQFFILFNAGIYLSAVIPYLLINGVHYPNAQIPYTLFLKDDMFYLIDCLPIIALQYLLSLKYKNFLVAIGIGFMLWIAALASLSWKYSYFIPYTYTMFYYFKGQIGGGRRAVIPGINIHIMAIAYFVLITITSYILYITKKEKG